MPETTLPRRIAISTSPRLLDQDRSFPIGGREIRRCLPIRQQNREHRPGRAILIIRLCFHGSPVAFCDLFANPQSQPRSNILFCSKKRLKYSLDVFWRNAGTIIFYLQLNCLFSNQLVRGGADFYFSF